MNLLLNPHVALWAIADLPPLHQDPFDRLLTHAPMVARYSDTIIAV